MGLNPGEKVILAYSLSIKAISEPNIKQSRPFTKLKGYPRVVEHKAPNAKTKHPKNARPMMSAEA